MSKNAMFSNTFVISYLLYSNIFPKIGSELKHPNRDLSISFPKHIFPKIGSELKHPSRDFSMTVLLNQSQINGTATLADNIADNGGLNQAYRAFERVGLKFLQNTTFKTYQFFHVQLSPEQLFFVSYGINWCSIGQNYRKYVERVKNDSHSPNNFRVNIPPSNMAQFAKAFNCTVGSPMNPEHKCSIW